MKLPLQLKKFWELIPPRLFAQPQQLSTNFYGKPNLLQTKFKWFQTPLQNYDAHTNTSSKHLLLSWCHLGKSHFKTAILVIFTHVLNRTAIWQSHYGVCLPSNEVSWNLHGLLKVALVSVQQADHDRPFHDHVPFHFQILASGLLFNKVRKW